MSLVLGACLGAAAGSTAALVWSRRRAQSLGRMGALLLHECNGPMTALLLSLHGAERLANLDISLGQARRLRALLGDLDDYLAMRTGGAQAVERQELEIRFVAEVPLGEQKGAFERADIPLIADLGGASSLVSVEKDRAQRAFGSLLAHALRFRAHGPVRVLASGLSLRLEYSGTEEPDLFLRSLETNYPASPKGIKAVPKAGLLGLTSLLLSRQGASLRAQVGADGVRVLIAEFPPAGGRP